MKEYKKYRYCAVRPKNIDRTYFYISDMEIPENSYVIVPFGYANRLRKGIVESVNFYTEENAPFPVSGTKKIIRMITETEYFADEDEDWDHYADTFMNDIDELESFIADENYDAIFQWACDHHEQVKFPDIMETVMQCYRLCMNHGNPSAALNLGSMYYNGTYVKRNYAKAFQFYEIAAAGGNQRAICNLGYCYYYGRHQAPDYQKAYEYFHLGAILYDDPNCLYKLGDMYLEGNYVDLNKKYAVILYFRALEAVNRPNEDDFCRPDILMRIGEIFLDGTVIDSDAKKALDFFMQALSGFYERRKTDPFVSALIVRVKSKIREAEEKLDGEII